MLADALAWEGGIVEQREVRVQYVSHGHLGSTAWAAATSGCVHYVSVQVSTQPLSTSHGGCDSDWVQCRVETWYHCP